MKRHNFFSFELHVYKSVVPFLKKSFNNLCFISSYNTESMFIQTNDYNDILYELFDEIYKYGLPFVICCFDNDKLIHYVYKFDSECEIIYDDDDFYLSKHILNDIEKEKLELFNLYMVI